MERDFMGLNCKNGVVTVKDEPADGSKGPAAVRGAGMQWSFSNKVSALPQLVSFKTDQEDRPRKTSLDSLTSSAHMTISAADAFGSNQKPLLGVIQKNMSMGKQAGNKHGTVYSPQHFDAHSACPQDARIFSISNQSNQGSPVLQSNLAITGQNMVSSAIKPQPLGGLPLIIPPSVIPSRGYIVGTPDLRNSSKSSGIPAQLTIFYAGSVCVYDGISPEKAQAIMLLAGNGSTPIQNKTISTAQVQGPVFRPSKDDGFILSQSFPSPLSSPLPVTSQLSSQPGGGSSSNNEFAIMKSVGSSATPSNHLESPNAVGSVGSAATRMVPPGLPQARKASLARFLEKRKERMMSTSPYYMSKNSPECSTPASDGVSFSVNYTGSCPLPAIKWPL